MKQPQNRLQRILFVATLALVAGLVIQIQAEQGKSTQVTRSNISNNKTATTECVATADGGDCDDAAAVKSPRDAASGQATGKRQHSPTPVVGSTEAAAGDVVAPRDVSSGQSSGKRQAVAGGDDVLETDETMEASAPRDAASGQATGKRQHKPVTIRKEIDKSSSATTATADVDGDGVAATSSQDHNSSRSNKSSSAAASDDYCCPGRCCPPGSAEATQAEAQPQTYKAKAGKTGSAK
jgi:hypothetical protein